MTTQAILSRAALLVAAIVVLPDFALAQQVPDTTSLAPVVVTATRVPVALGSPLVATTVITGKELRASGVSDVLTALRAVPGVAIVRAGSAGAQSSLFVRGGESDYVKVLVDGVPANDPGGSIDLANLTTDNVERIEIVRGPTSVLYGSDAVAGVVQVFTRAGERGVRAGASARAGTFGSSRYEADVSGGSSRFSGSLGVARHATDGIRAFNNEYRNEVVSARARLVPDDRSLISLAARYGDNTFHYPTDGSGNVVDRNARRAEERASVGLDASRFIVPSVQLSLGATLLRARGSTDDEPDSATDTLGFHAYRARGTITRQAVDLEATWFASPSAILTAGAEAGTDRQQSADSSNYDTARNRFSASRRNTGVYAQLLGDAGLFSYTLGGRYDDNEVFGTFTTYRAGAAIRLARSTRLRASIGTAFKAPTFFENFSTAFSTGNAALDPERSTSWEIGAEQALAGERLTLSATWFDQSFRDMIQYTSQGVNLPNYFNIAAASASGAELEVRSVLPWGLHADVSATLLRTRVDDAGFDEGEGATFVKGNRLLRRPATSAALTLGYARGALSSLSLTTIYVGERDDRDFASFPANAVILPSYLRLDLAAEYQLLRGTENRPALALTLRAENLFDRSYEEVARFAAPRRLVLAGVRIETGR